VQRYVRDLLCGYAFTNELVRDIFVGLALPERSGVGVSKAENGSGYDRI
jgi:hypothetical protein